MSTRARRPRLAAAATVTSAVVLSGAVGLAAAWGTADEPAADVAASLSAGDTQAPPAAPVTSAAPEPYVVAQVTEQHVTLSRPDPSTRLSANGSNLWRASAITDNSIPSAALRAYKAAEATMAATQPGCGITWTLLAAIGRVESNHGQYAGSVLGSDGVSRPGIRGVALNGNGVAAISDTDGGRLDGDTRWDRAVGPMQFIPSTWAGAGRDGDGDGVKTPNDIDDAALAAAEYLCPDTGSLNSAGALRTAIYRYNHSDYYVDLVLSFKRGYETGVFSVPSPPPVAVPAGPGFGGQAPAAPAGASTRTPGSGADGDKGKKGKKGKGATASVDDGNSGPKPAKPSPTPTPTAPPVPTPTETPPNQTPEPTPNETTAPPTTPATPSETPSPTPSVTPTPTEPQPSPDQGSVTGLLSTDGTAWYVGNVEVVPADETVVAALDALKDQNVTVTIVNGVVTQVALAP